MNSSMDRSGDDLRHERIGRLTVTTLALIRDLLTLATNSLRLVPIWSSGRGPQNGTFLYCERLVLNIANDEPWISKQRLRLESGLPLFHPPPRVQL
jgi:hypothetical protein